MTRSRRVTVLMVAVILLAPLTEGCSAHRIRVTGSDLGDQNYRRETSWSYAWGLAEGKPIQMDCDGARVAEVKVESNLGHKLLTFVTLGAVAPVRVCYKCAAPLPAGGDTGEAPEARDPLDPLDAQDTGVVRAAD